jgi:acetate kinase
MSLQKLEVLNTELEVLRSLLRIAHGMGFLKVSSLGYIVSQIDEVGKMRGGWAKRYKSSKSGLLGVSGISDDIRLLLTAEEQGDSRAKLALGIFIYRIQLAIGQLAASMGGVDSIVFTGTIGERSAVIRGRILDKLEYLGFIYHHDNNSQVFEPAEATNIAIDASKPAWVISTDEAAEIARRVGQYIMV